ncbi:hypothetical protein COLO4_02958 [Corchorus olitorius]|uniref:Uncharacterized protein n=1 Tax=Corchorus olitorius TaxID=93759 RepID=A0A1R3KRU1_9ROSI|nr:hypothetical protein COLO4_05143 [Corchorus olitorius]OMP12613.1 hypothetical protein COLO4_02958 [Corchorus olitorius]
MTQSRALKFTSDPAIQPFDWAGFRGKLKGRVKYRLFRKVNNFD